MSDKKRKVPKLRFPGFTDDWEQRKLGDEFQKVNERNDGSFGREHWISVAKMYFQEPEKVQSNNIDTRTYVMREGDIAFEGHPNSEFKFGRFVANDIGSGVVSELFPIYRHKVQYDNKYWKYAIQLERIMAPIFAKSITSSGNSSNKLEPSHFLRQSMPVATYEEQRVIGDFLNKLESLLSLHQRKLDNVKMLKKSLLQKLFPKDGEKIPELRFPGFTDAWEQRKLGDYLEVSKEKNKDGKFDKEDVLSVSGSYGIVNQIEFQGRSFAGASVANYGVVKIGDVVYTKSPLKSNPYGIIKTNKVKTGIVSTLYAVYSPLKNTHSDFIQTYFEQDARMNNYMSPLVNKGAKNDMKVSDENALKGEVVFPSKEEQFKISEYFERLNNLISLHQRKLDHLKELKKGLLQQMFV